MDLKERILAYMHEEAYRPLPAEELADGMQLTPEDLVQFDAALEELEKETLPLSDDSLTFEARPKEIVTIRLNLDEAEG